MWDKKGYRLYKEQYMMQSNVIFDCIPQFLNRYNFDTIIEIGTAFAGFSLFLEDHSRHSKIHSFDINKLKDIENEMPMINNLDPRIARQHLQNTKVNYHIVNTHKPDGINFIQDIIKEGGRCAVFCDGGNKQLEYNIYSNIIKKHDLILAHDYAHTQMSKTVWAWHEICYKDIEQSNINNNIKPIEQLEQAAWFAGIKG